MIMELQRFCSKCGKLFKCSGECGIMLRLRNPSACFCGTCFKKRWSLPEKEADCDSRFRPKNLKEKEREKVIFS